MLLSAAIPDSLSPSLTPLLAALLVLVVSLARVESAIVRYNLTASNGLWSPDCVQRQVGLLNGQFPGPTLSGVVGDTMVVTVFNKMASDGITIHWHGLKMLGNNLNDGTAFVTQCPIGPNDKYTYTFKLSKAGTFFYHGHLGLGKTSGHHGLLIVSETAPLPSVPPTTGSLAVRNKTVTFPAYDGELHMLLDDWYHLTSHEQEALLDNNEWVDTPQSLLINGRGQYDCAAIPASTSPFVTGDVKTCNAIDLQCGPQVFEVQQGKTYRIRIVSVASMASLNLVLEGHSFSVVAADAYSVKPFSVGTEGLDVYSGQAVDVVFTANQSVGNYWVRTALFGLPYNPSAGRAILRYTGAAVANPSTAIPPLARAWFDTDGPYAQAVKYKARTMGIPQYGDTPSTSQPNPPALPLILDQVPAFFNGRIWYFISNASLALPSTPYALGLARRRYDLYQKIPFPLSAPMPLTTGPLYYNFGYKKFIDIVVQNNGLPQLGGAQEIHPWHMHGHHFWVLAHGNGTFNPSTDVALFNTVDPPFRHTVPTLANGAKAWTAIRFRADNPGAWLFHCHVEFHLHFGMGIVFTDGYVKPLPKKTRLCGDIY